MTIDLKSIRERAERATKGPWTAMAEGNQYINCRYLPTATLVAASRVDGIQRPWNPYSMIAFGIKPEQHEAARFLDEDADFIAHSRTDIPALLDAVEEIRAFIAAIVITKHFQEDYPHVCIELKKWLAQFPSENKHE